MLSHKAKNKSKQITFLSLILTIIATEFGFSNITNAYFQMGYASIIWYIICAIVFLFPLAMIFAEYSGSIKKDHGGFYSWLVNSLGEKWAFIGTFVWVSSWLITILQTCSGLGVHISGIIYGKDISQTWHFLMLNGNQIEALLGIIVTIVTTFFATKGVKKIIGTARIGGIVSLCVITIFVGCSLTIFIADKGHMMQPIHNISNFFKSPNVNFQSPIALMSFIIYAMFAFGGLESSSGFIDKLQNPRKNYPKVMICEASILAGLYSISIFICGFGINWKKVMGAPGINLYNNTFAMMNGLGESLAHSLGLSASTGAIMGDNLNRLLSIGSLIPLISFMIVLTYSPIKSLIAGSSKDLWPKKIAHFNKHDMPGYAMWIECLIIVVILAGVSVSGNTGQQFYTIITDMGNIGNVFPYYFIIIGFIAFKKRKDLDHKIIFFHSKATTYIAVGMLLTSITFGIIFNLINPIIEHQYSTAFWTFIGPVFFTGLASIMYHMGLKRRAKRHALENSDY